VGVSVGGGVSVGVTVIAAALAIGGGAWLLAPRAAHAQASYAKPAAAHPDPGDEPWRPAADVEVSTLGRVTYASVSAEVPLSPRTAVVPAVELLHLSPVAADPQRELHPYFGAGIAGKQSRDWDWELAFLYGPRASGVSSLGVTSELSAALGAERPVDGLPPWELTLALGATLFGWDFVSPIGPGVTQLSAELTAVARLPAALVLRPEAAIFAYDRSLAPRTPGDVDTLSVLARLGTYAPRASVGARLLWKVTPQIAPLVGADELVYASGVGTGTRIEGGLRLDFGHGLHATLAGGLLHNRLQGVASRIGDPRTVPLLRVGMRISF
jgi:hypothetical protein